MFHIFSILLKVSRVLPDWLASPNVIASDLKHKTTSVSEFKGLDPDIHLNLKENKIDYFFPGIYVIFIAKILKFLSNQISLFLPQ